MHFCTQCKNMYYLKIRDGEGENSLIYYCRNCGNEDNTLNSENVCVSDIQLRRSEQKYTYMVNEYTKYDPTLPRINNIKCPNQECMSNAQHKGGAGTSKKDTGTGTAGTGTGATIKISKKTKEAALAKRASKLAVEKMIEQEEASEAANASEAAVEASETAANASAAPTVLASKEDGENEHNREIIYIRYDDVNMKYVYLCVHCDTMWKTDNRN